MQNTENCCSTTTTTSPVWFPAQNAGYKVIARKASHLSQPSWSPSFIPKRRPGLSVCPRYTALLLGTRVCALCCHLLVFPHCCTLMEYPNYACNRASALPSPSPFHYDFRYMKFIYLHCGEEMKLRDPRNWEHY